jgi:hypothetical protein
LPGWAMPRAWRMAGMAGARRARRARARGAAANPEG